MRVLGIESSCDECSLSVVEDGRKVLALCTYSQLKEHREFGGVVPELASRLHVQYIASLYELLLSEIECTHEQMKDYIEAIAVTVSPGLSGSLLVGLHFAKGLALTLSKPLIGIDHIHAHFYSSQLEQEIVYPHIGVVVSGGHTLLGVVHGYNDINILGHSIDDACGEAFDKIARELDLGYPGGAHIDALAQQGAIESAQFPIYYDRDNPYNFSYSGLKTAVLHHRNKYWNTEYSQSIENIAASFQDAAIRMIIDRLYLLVKSTHIPRIVFGGGVASNSHLRILMGTMKQNVQENMGISLEVVIPPLDLCIDNAAMIAGLGFCYLQDGIISDINIGVQSRHEDYKNTSLS